MHPAGEDVGAAAMAERVIDQSLDVGGEPLPEQAEKHVADIVGEPASPGEESVEARETVDRGNRLPASAKRAHVPVDREEAENRGIEPG